MNAASITNEMATSRSRPAFTEGTRGGCIFCELQMVVVSDQMRSTSMNIMRDIDLEYPICTHKFGAH